jgi:hypothetical protein
MSLDHSAETTVAPVTDGQYPSVPMTPLRPAPAASQPRDDAYPGVLRTLAMFLFAR